MAQTITEREGCGTIFWIGHQGRQLSQYHLLFQDAQAQCPPPNVILIHLGANDIGQVPIRYIMGQYRELIAYAQLYWPGAQLAFSGLIGRTVYRHIAYRKAENVRLRINSFLRSLPNPLVRHEQLDGTDGLLQDDGVHLTSVGNAFFLSNILKCTQRLICATRQPAVFHSP